MRVCSAPSRSVWNVMATAAPSRANSNAIACPMPESAPVTTATLLASLGIQTSWREHNPALQCAPIQGHRYCCSAPAPGRASHPALDSPIAGVSGRAFGGRFLHDRHQFEACVGPAFVHTHCYAAFFPFFATGSPTAALNGRNPLLRVTLLASERKRPDLISANAPECCCL